MREGEREANLQRQRRALQYATISYSPSKVTNEWRNIPLFADLETQFNELEKYSWEATEGLFCMDYYKLPVVASFK